MTWQLTGFERGGEALTHEVNLDDAIGRLLGLPAGERGPVPVSREAVATLGRIVELPLDEGLEPFILEQQPPSGWILREAGGDGPVDDDTDIDIDWVLLAVFARVLGEDLAYMQGPGFGGSFPLDRSTFARIARIFEVDADFDAALWFLDQYANTPLDN